MPTTQRIDGIALAAIFAGSLFAYAGIKDKSILSIADMAIHGQSPATAAVAGAGLGDVNPPGAGGGAAGSGSASGLVGIAQSYVGKLTYVFGGPPPMGTVDCSSFASKCLAQAGISNPGGAPYDPRTHGPNTISYLSWIGAKTIGHSASDAQAGDLCVWQTHMGICIGNGKMVSARDPAEGVGVDNIAGDMPFEILFVRRLV